MALIKSMASNKVGRLTFLLFVCGAILLGANIENVNAKVCPLICFDYAGYMTCPSSGNEHLSPSCNCCLAPTGCTLWNADGTPICTSN
ncbi:Proteinase inhibitor type-2 [Quillaja saponaria]|uniref:Proteinase inhibitor type-2 n=1 Tax=Quillaja saponaria TaxID=32244 RepID=A0AAD7QJS8_QUISA|nr:Proteinase inhibitor type-2 [Quillaja saponaria]